MESLEDVFVADAVSHAYNMAESNYRVPRYAQQIRRLGGALEGKMPAGYVRTEESFRTDWPVEYTENVLQRPGQLPSSYI